jgi:hypothetical protein
VTDFDLDDADEARAINYTRTREAADALLEALAAPINGRATVTVHDYIAARRLISAALLAVFEAAESQQEPPR